MTATKAATETLPFLYQKPSQNIHTGQQGKHIVGYNNFDPKKSPLTVDAQTLLDGIHAGGHPIVKYNIKGRPVADFGHVIGEVKGVKTNFGTIHYEKKGAHIVPF